MLNVLQEAFKRQESQDLMPIDNWKIVLQWVLSLEPKLMLNTVSF
jgi:hypothetical protein